MELLLSNYPPMKTYYKSFSDAFYGLLSKSLRLDIAVGYVSSDALIELQKAIELNHNISEVNLATVYKGNIIKNLIMDCQSYTKYRPNETTGGIFVSWQRKEELPTGA